MGPAFRSVSLSGRGQTLHINKKEGRPLKARIQLPIFLVNDPLGQKQKRIAPVFRFR